VDNGKLAKMVNQIAANFDVGNDAAAVAGTVDHLRRFWTPDMRRAIVAYADSGRGDLSKLAALAVEQLARERAA